MILLVWGGYAFFFWVGYAMGSTAEKDKARKTPSGQQVLDRISTLGLPLKHLQTIANAFGGYVEVKLLPLKPNARGEAAPITK